MSVKRKANDKPIYYSGEHMCSAVTGKMKSCDQKAYFLLNGALRCGRHANKNTKRTVLQKNPRAKEIRQKQLEDHRESIDAAAAQNREAGRGGTVDLLKLRMMKSPELTPGVLLVFPNNKHENRNDGFGCCMLSPMRLGPVMHGQAGLPPSKTIENYHQFNKVFSIEQDKEGNPLPVYYEKRAEAYADPIPHRHKYDRADLKKANRDMVNGINTPMYSIHLDATGKERRYTYMQSRLFYCHFYELLAKEQDKFRQLQDKIRNGVNVRIAGYDAHAVHPDGLYADYCNTTKPFGHELVLYSLLTVANPAEYPWNRFYRENREIYDPLPFPLTEGME